MSIEMDETIHYGVETESEHEGLLETLGANMMPLLATGVSLLWLISSIRGTPPIPGKVRRAASRIGDRASAAMAPMGEKAGDLLAQARDVASQMQEKAVGLGHQVQEKAHHVQERASGQASHSLESATAELSRLIEERPLVVCGAAALLGVALGFLVPESRKEHALLGPVKENMVEKARAIVEDMKENAKARVETVREKAQQAIDEVTEQSSRPGLAEEDEVIRISEDLTSTTRDSDVGLTDAYFGPGSDEQRNL